MVFLQAMWIGLLIAAPVGPIGLLVIQRTLRHGRAAGIATGLGAAVADAAYGAVGAYGITAVTGALQQARTPLAVVGGAFLLWLAWRTWPHAAPAGEVAVTLPAPGLASAFAGTLLLTLANPATALSFAAVFAALAGSAETVSPGSMVAGVLAGSALWWLALCALVGALRQRFGVRQQRWVARASALMLAGFALWSMAQVVPASA